MGRPHQDWIEELGYSIEEWSPNEERLIEVLGRVHLMEIGSVGLLRGHKYAASVGDPLVPRCPGASRA